MMSFTNYLVDKNDDIDNAAFALAQALVRNGEIDWNMEIIGAITASAEAILENEGYKTCHPFYEGDDRCPCYRGEDCDRANCPALKR